MKKIRAGVVGCGNISRFHFSGLAKAGAGVAWVCDISPDASRPWAAKFGARATADYRDITADPSVDAVVVTTVSSLHKPVCLAAIEAGKAVVCEKTLAENADDALEIVRAAEKKGVCFYTSYMKRFIPAVARAKELLPSIGRIVSTHIRAYQCWGDLWGEVPPESAVYTPPAGTSLIKRLYGGGILVCGGSHILDLVCFLLGRPTRLYASVHIPHGRDTDAQAAALLETENGIVHYEALAHPLSRIGFLRDGWDERIEIVGLKGRLEIWSAKWDEWEHKASLLIHHDNETGRSVEYRYAPDSPFDRAVGFFCEWIARGEQGPQSRRTGYDVDELIAHILRSGASGEAVTVGWRI